MDPADPAAWNAGSTSGAGRADRDGTFPGADGRIVGGVRNLCFTPSALAALAAVQAVGDALQLTGDLFHVAPALPVAELGDFTTAY